MSLDKTAQNAASSISTVLSDYGLSDQEKLEILKIVEASLVQTVEETTTTNVDTACNLCGPEADLAHQIRAEMTRKKNLLISNLKAMR